MVWIFLATKYFKIKVWTLFSKTWCYCRLNRQRYSVNFICTGKPNDLCDLLYRNIHVTDIVWKRTHNILLKHLYSSFPSYQRGKLSKTPSGCQKVLDPIYTRVFFLYIHSYNYILIYKLGTVGDEQ